MPPAAALHRASATGVGSRKVFASVVCFPLVDRLQGQVLKLLQRILNPEEMQEIRTHPAWEQQNEVQFANKSEVAGEEAQRCVTKANGQLSQRFINEQKELGVMERQI